MIREARTGRDTQLTIAHNLSGKSSISAHHHGDGGAYIAGKVAVSAHHHDAGRRNGTVVHGCPDHLQRVASKNGDGACAGLIAIKSENAAIIRLQQLHLSRVAAHVAGENIGLPAGSSTTGSLEYAAARNIP